MAGHAVVAQHFSGGAVLRCELEASGGPAERLARVSWIRPDDGFKQAVVAAAGDAARDALFPGRVEGGSGESVTDEGSLAAARATWAAQENYENDPTLVADKAWEMALLILTAYGQELAGLAQHLIQHGEMPIAYAHPATINRGGEAATGRLPVELTNRETTCVFKERLS